MRAFERPVFMRACCPTTQNQGYVRFKMLPIQLTAWYLFPCRHLFFFTYWHEHKLQMKLMRSVHLILLFNLFFSLVASQHSLSSNRFLSLLNNYPVYYIAEQKCKRRKRVKKAHTHTHTHPTQTSFNAPTKCQNHRNSKQSSLHLTFSCSLLCCRYSDRRIGELFMADIIALFTFSTER